MIGREDVPISRVLQTSRFRIASVSIAWGVTKKVRERDIIKATNAITDIHLIFNF